MSLAGTVIITPHEYYMILPALGISAASVYYLALALRLWCIAKAGHIEVRGYTLSAQSGRN